ncbi:MAG: helix-turn-helix domain-containing protein [Bacilli bacterium]|nr:helix-turn-helix domain-containing protein [Bacilli bacterium]
MNQQKIGKFIQESRKNKNLTQVELAEKLGVSNRTISKWENGNCLPDYSMFNILCDELDISINELLSGEKLNEKNYQKKLEENFVSTIDYNNKKRNKTIKKFIILLIVIFLLYFLYKAFIVYFYYKDNVVYSYKDNKFPYNQNIYTIKINKNDMANTLVLDDLNIYIPEGFELVTDKAKSSFVMDGCEPFIKGNRDTSDYDAVILVCHASRVTNLDNLDYHGIYNTFFPWLNIDLLRKKYQIEDSIDLIKFYEKNYKFKQNIFTSSDDVKINFVARNYANLTIPSYDEFYYLENDLRGYSIEKIRNDDSYFQDTILSFSNGNYNEINYSISFYNKNVEFFNHENSFEIISSISRN